jgi:hypothetical protein
MPSKVSLVLAAATSLAMTSDVTVAQTGENSRGLWQINMTPRTPAAKKGTDMRPWTTTHSGSSGQRLTGARFHGGRLIQKPGTNPSVKR